MVKMIFEFWNQLALILSNPSVHKYDFASEISCEFTAKFWHFGQFQKNWNLIENFTLSKQNVPISTFKCNITQRWVTLSYWEIDRQNFPVVTERRCKLYFLIISQHQCPFIPFGLNFRTKDRIYDFFPRLISEMNDFPTFKISISKANLSLKPDFKLKVTIFAEFERWSWS